MLERSRRTRRSWGVPRDSTYSLHCSSFLGLPYRILIIYLVKPQKGPTMETIGNIPEIRNIPKIIAGSLICFKVYSLIKGYWSLWVGPFRVSGSGFRVLGLGLGEFGI